MSKLKHTLCSILSLSLILFTSSIYANNENSVTYTFQIVNSSGAIISLYLHPNGNTHTTFPTTPIMLKNNYSTLLYDVYKTNRNFDIEIQGNFGLICNMNFNSRFIISLQPNKCIVTDPLNSNNYLITIVNQKIK